MKGYEWCRVVVSPRDGCVVMFRDECGAFATRGMRQGSGLCMDMVVVDRLVVHRSR